MVNDCATVAAAAAEGAVVRTPTGDGMAITFFDDCSSPLRCAMELAQKIDAQRTFAVRMGIHTGEVVRQLDVNANTNVSGDGINIAQRVMDFGDGGHILMSLEYATSLQERGDPAAADCHDIGVATAKHGKRVHLFNYHRPSIGTAEVPVKVRKDDQWARPKQLRLGTSGRNIFVATLQILGWLFVAPSKWRTHVTQIDPRLSPNFSVIDLTGPQIRRNPDLRQLLIQVYVICPAMLALLIWIALTIASKVHAPAHAGVWIGMMVGMGYLATVLLGIGAGFVGFVILTFQALVQGPAIEFFGLSSIANMIAISAVCVWGFVALTAVFPMKRSFGIAREVCAAVASAVIAILFLTVPLTVAANSPPTQRAVVLAVASFILVNLVIGLRWRRWSRGLAFGQLVGLLLAVMWFIGGDVLKPGMAARQSVVVGFVNGLTSGVLWASAFAIGDKIAGARAAIAAGLLITVLLNVRVMGGWWSLLPLIALWTTYAVMRRQKVDG